MLLTALAVRVREMGERRGSAACREEQNRGKGEVVRKGEWATLRMEAGGAKIKVRLTHA